MSKRIAKIRAAAKKRIANWKGALKRRIDAKRGHMRHRIRKIKARHQAAKGPTVMYDSVTVAAIPTDAPAVAYYVEGDPYPNGPAVKAHAPKAKYLSIALYSHLHARCFDIEPGGGTNAQAPSWFRSAKSNGQKLPVLYTMVSNADALVSTMGASGVGRHEYVLWTAHYSYKPHVCSPSCYPTKQSADGTQWTNKAKGLNLDQSLLHNDFWA